mmetsp:Transcript_16266/g.32968  ORF Transcript_16266/g.32968 Transcript_16266/m.32968 type:complete len:232 (-) Transcript_16266:177-872(-)
MYRPPLTVGRILRPENDHAVLCTRRDHVRGRGAAGSPCDVPHPLLVTFRESRICRFPLMQLDPPLPHTHICITPPSDDVQVLQAGLALPQRTGETHGVHSRSMSLETLRLPPGGFRSVAEHGHLPVRGSAHQVKAALGRSKRTAVHARLVLFMSVAGFKCPVPCLLPDDHPLVVRAGSQQISEFRVCPGHLPHRPVMPQQFTKKLGRLSRNVPNPNAVICRGSCQSLSVKV